MLALNLDAEDLASVRFACSALQETVVSLWIWRNPVRYAIHQPLVRGSSHLLGSFDWPLLQAVIGPGGFLPDFLTPCPGSPRPDIDTELAVVRATSAERVVSGLKSSANGQPLHPRLRGVHTDPLGLLEEIGAALESYWELVIAPHWPRLSVILETDIRYRAKRLVEGGMQGLFGDLDERLRWTNRMLKVDEPDVELSVEVKGRGLTFTPSLFCRRAVTMIDLSLPPRICYPARGRATAWGSAPAESGKALADLLGPTRAKVLSAIAEPSSTAHLAFLLGLSQGTVSQHLGVLHQAGLAEKSRSGHMMLYVRSHLGDRLAK